MHYRRFGRLDWPVSALGFGAMRLPVIDRDQTKIDEPEAVRMIRRAIDAGVNYLDTAYPYHGGHSERVVGKALQNGYREKIRLATKMPSWAVQSAGDFDKYLDEQLQKLQTKRIDYYLLHGLNSKRWPALRDFGVTKWAERAILSGRIGYLGFSFHDNYAAFKGILDDYDGWTFCQIQYNFMDIEEQAGTKGLQYAASKGLAVVIMEPLLGGRLVQPPPPVQAIWDGAATKRTPVDWALRWLWSQPEVSVVLSGMSAMSQVEENLACASADGYDVVRDEERALYDGARERYESLCPIPCTKCEYCLPCQQELPIPRLFELLNSGAMYGNFQQSRRQYAMLPEKERANLCEQCRKCEELCPQQIPISEWMLHVHGVLAERKPMPDRLPGR